jgi:hypothetical protein
MVTECKDNPARKHNLETIVAGCEHVDKDAQLMQSVSTGRKGGSEQREASCVWDPKGASAEKIGSTARRKRECSG